MGEKSAYVGLRGHQNKISLEMVNGSGMNIDKLEHTNFTRAGHITLENIKDIT